MAARSAPIGVAIVGIILIAISLAADRLGIGAAPGIGWRQLVGAGVGMVLAVAGIAMARPART